MRQVMGLNDQLDQYVSWLRLQGNTIDLEIGVTRQYISRCEDAAKKTSRSAWQLPQGACLVLVPKPSTIIEICYNTFIRRIRNKHDAETAKAQNEFKTHCRFHRAMLSMLKHEIDRPLSANERSVTLNDQIIHDKKVVVLDRYGRNDGKTNAKDLYLSLRWWDRTSYAVQIMAKQPGKFIVSAFLIDEVAQEFDPLDVRTSLAKDQYLLPSSFVFRWLAAHMKDLRGVGMPIGPIACLGDNYSMPGKPKISSGEKDEKKSVEAEIDKSEHHSVQVEVTPAGNIHCTRFYIDEVSKFCRAIGYIPPKFD